MGVGCFNSQLIINNENKSYTNIMIQNNNIFLSPSAFEKINKFQKRIKGYLNKVKFRKKVKFMLEKLNLELDNIKLLNSEIVTNSNSYKHYQNYFKKGLFKPFSEYINKNKSLSNQLKIMSEFTLNLPYYIVISQKLAYKGHLNLNKKYHGYGILFQYNKITKKDRIIEGIFYNGVFSGYGRITLSNGEMLRGNFEKNKLNGLGEYRRKDDSIYMGIFSNGYPQGQGKEIFKDGSFYEGYYLKGIKKYGKFEWKNKDRYEGYFENDLFHGNGIYEWSNKKRYEGEWKFGKMNGKGKLVYANGSYYEGDFVNGLKEGKGKYFWKHDNYYNGEWKDDMQNGYGTYYKNGQKIRGIWENGKFKNETILKSITNVRSRKIFSSEKMRINFDENKQRFSISSNDVKNLLNISTKKNNFFSPQKIKNNDEKVINLFKNKEPNISSKYSNNGGFGSVYSINSIEKEDKK